MRVLSQSLRPALVLTAAALTAVVVTFASFAIFGPLMGMVTFVVYIGFVPALFMSRVGKSTIAAAKAPWGTISVGADGVLVESVAKLAFYAFGDLVSVRAQGADRVILRLADGETVDLACNDSDEVERAIELSWARHQAAKGTRHAEIEMGDEDIPGYLARVRGLVQGGGFRARAVGEQELVAVATDPKSPPKARVAAVAALEHAPAPVRTKIRVAVDATAEPALRGALEEALEGSLRASTVAAL